VAGFEVTLRGRFWVTPEDIAGVLVVDEKGKTWQVQRQFFQGNPPYVISLDVGFHFKEKGKLTTDIIVKEGKLTDLLRIPPDLSYYSDLIVKVVKLFEEFSKV
jgi:hypothetical protein